MYVGNLPPEVDEQSLAMVFSYFGHIENVQVRPCAWRSARAGIRRDSLCLLHVGLRQADCIACC